MRVWSENRPRAGATVWVAGSRYDTPLTPVEAREFAAALCAEADKAEAAENRHEEPGFISRNVQEVGR